MASESVAAKRRPPEDVVRKYNQSGFSDPSTVFVIPWFQVPGSDNWNCVPVKSLDYDSFDVTTGGGRIVFKADDLKPDSDGKIVLDIRGLTHPLCTDRNAMEEIEFPPEILEKWREAQREKRRIKSLEKDAIFVERTREATRYYFIEDGKLRVLQGEKEIVVDHIEVIYGRKAINAEGLAIGHPFLELPEIVAEKFENALIDQNLALVLEGTSLLNGAEYYRLNMKVPAETWNSVKKHFEDFGYCGDLKGWLTRRPETVAEILRIPILD